MPYFLTEAKCVCGSRINIFNCHGNKSSRQNIYGRIEGLIRFISTYQDELFLLQQFNSLEFRKIRFSFVEPMESMRKITALSFELGMGSDVAIFGSDGSGDLIPSSIPPEVIFYLNKRIDWNDQDGLLVLKPGVYRLYLDSWRDVQGGAVANLVFKSENLGLIEVGGQPKLKVVLNMELFWDLIRKRMGVVKSIVLLDTEVIRHSAA